MSALNAIVDVEVAARAGWTPIDLTRAYLDGGARFLQIRAKGLPSGPLLELAERVCEMAHAAGATVIVNDRADVARLSGADGLHVGQDDLAPAAARAIIGPDALLGLSTHTVAQIASAVRQPVTYVAVGPVFGTSTKATGYSAVGLERVRYAVDMIGPSAISAGHRGLLPPGFVPFGIVAIGGITLENAVSVLEAGASSVAVITDLLATGDPEARVRAYLARFDAWGVSRAKV
jgi:thiamine-phosphate pyrophosphorylase